MGCVKDAFCAGRCPARGNEFACAAVGMIDSYQPALARRIAAARAASTRVVIATFERDNAAKHAISKLRASCGGTSLKGNHRRAPPLTNGSRDDVSTSLPHALMFIKPRLFRAEATQSLVGRRRLRAGVSRTLGGRRYALHYEDLQLDPEAAVRALMHATGVAGFNAVALARSALRKGSSEDLRRSLLNFDSLHSSLADAPCLQRMLAAPRPQRFDDACTDTDTARPVDGAPVLLPTAHQAKQDVSVRVLRCARSMGAVATNSTCTLASMNRPAASAVAATMWAAGLRARRKRRRRQGSLPLDSATVDGGTSTPPSAALAAAMAGGCNQEEEQMCVQALRQVGSRDETQKVVTEVAEVCVLSAVDEP